MLADFLAAERDDSTVRVRASGFGRNDRALVTNGRHHRQRIAGLDEDLENVLADSRQDLILIGIPTDYGRRTGAPERVWRQNNVC